MTPVGTVIQVDAGHEPSFGIRIDGTAVCWGHISAQPPQ